MRLVLRTILFPVILIMVHQLKGGARMFQVNSDTSKLSPYDFKLSSRLCESIVDKANK